MDMGGYGRIFVDWIWVDMGGYSWILEDMRGYLWIWGRPKPENDDFT